ncbi:MAG: glycosyltransferase, partial [Myxococcota bacterium]
AVASSSGGGGEIVLDGLTGRVVDPEDTAALEEALVGLLRDPEAARRMGREARKRVQRYEWRRGVLDLERVLTAASP